MQKFFSILLYVMKSPQSESHSWYTSLVGKIKKLSKSTLIRRGLVILLGIIVLGAGLGYATPRVISSTLAAPRLTKQPADKNNQDIVFESRDNIVAEREGRLFWPAPNRKNTLEFGKLEGKQTIKFFNYVDLGFTKVKSVKFTEVGFESNYVAPTFSELDIQKAYPNKEDAFSFKLSDPNLIVYNDNKVVFDPKETENECVKEVISDPKYKLTCQFAFGEKKELSLNYTIKDTFGNSTDILKNVLVKNVELPKLECDSPTEYAKTSPLAIKCTASKNGTMTDNSGNSYNLEKDKPLEFTIPLKNGVNTSTFVYRDEDEFELTKEFRTTLDNTAPELTFTFLDTKKKFQEGNFTLKFKANETVTTDIRVRPYNETFENDPRMKSPLFAKTWGYYGGSSESRTVPDGEEAAIVTKNDLGGCQLYETPIDGKKLLQTPQGLCDLYNVFFVKTDITAKDRAGNTSSYQCTSYTWDPNKNPSGDLVTECKKMG